MATLDTFQQSQRLKKRIAEKEQAPGTQVEGGEQSPREKQSVKDTRFHAATRQFVYTMVGWTKTLPVKSHGWLRNIHLS
jgi:hypothetical protein